MPLLSVDQTKLTSEGQQQEVLSSDVSDARAEEETEVQAQPTEPTGTGPTRDELLSHSHKYLDLVDRTQQQLQSKFKKFHQLSYSPESNYTV